MKSDFVLPIRNSKGVWGSDTLPLFPHISKVMRMCANIYLTK